MAATADGRRHDEAVPRQKFVGIFWWMPDDAGVQCLVSDALPVSEAEPYGDCLTHPRGHHEVWEQWRRLSPAQRKSRGVPNVVATEEYETFPRGRIVLYAPSDTFWIYADRRLQRPGIVMQIKRRFGLDGSKCDLKSDEHYC